MSNEAYSLKIWTLLIFTDFTALYLYVHEVWDNWKSFAAEQCELDRVRQRWAPRPPVMREVGLVLTTDSGHSTLQPLARLSRQAEPLGAPEALTHAASSPGSHQTIQTWAAQSGSDSYLSLRGKSTCGWSMQACSWSWINSIVHRGANTPCLGWQQKYSILSTNPPWRPTGFNSSTPAHIPG